MRISGTVVAALAVLAASPALAQDAPSWNGAYIGGQLGLGFQPNDKDETIRFDNNLDGTFGDTVTTAAAGNPDAFSRGFCGGAAAGPEPSAGCGSDFDGVDWKVHAGYDRQFGNVVVGLVGEYGRATITDSVSAFSTTPAYYTMTRRLKDNASIRARAGVGFNNTLVYATGGGAWGKIKNSFATNNGANDFSGSGDSDAWGYRVGGGVEQRLTPTVSLGLQYLYTSLKDDDYTVRATQGRAPATNPFVRTNAGGTDFRRSGERFNSHAVSIAANFRF